MAVSRIWERLDSLVDLCGHENVRSSTSICNAVDGRLCSRARCRSSLSRRPAWLDAGELRGEAILLQSVERRGRRERHAAHPHGIQALSGVEKWHGGSHLPGWGV